MDWSTQACHLPQMQGYKEVKQYTSCTTTIHPWKKAKAKKYRPIFHYFKILVISQKWSTKARVFCNNYVYGKFGWNWQHGYSDAMLITETRKSQPTENSTFCEWPTSFKKFSQKSSNFRNVRWCISPQIPNFYLTRIFCGLWKFWMTLTGLSQCSNFSK